MEESIEVVVEEQVVVEATLHEWDLDGDDVEQDP
jgi:hypothetical protein